MRKTYLALAATALACAPALSQAGDLSYSYIDLGYVETDLDGIGPDLDGFVLRGSLELGSNVFLFAQYLDQSASDSGVKLDGETYGVGVGYAWSFADNMDLYGKLGYVRSEATVRGFGERFSADDDGYQIGFGIRALPIELLELEGAVNYTDLSDSGDDTSFGVAARWRITPQFALGVEAEFADDAKAYGIGFRWTFGQ
jgi:hypothetical protein